MRNLIFAMTGVLAACDGGGGGADGVDANPCPARVGTWCVQQEVRDCYDAAATIGQGVYGCVAEQPDVGNPLPPAHAVRGWQVDVYADLGRTTLLGSATTSANGFYELPAAAGTVYFCTTSPSQCHPFTIPTGTLAVDGTISVLSTWEAR